MPMNLILNSVFAILSLGLTQAFYRLAQNTRLMDKPNARSLHTVPTVRGSGVIFVLLFLLAFPILSLLTQTSMADYSLLFVSICLLAGISFMDDLYNLSAKIRFTVQTMVVLLITFFMPHNQLDFLLFSLTNQYLIALFIIFTLLWAINHFNFMDGLDGFAAHRLYFICSLWFITNAASSSFFNRIMHCIGIYPGWFFNL